MAIIVSNKISGLRSSLERFRRDGERIGFVPTMGALHPGHLSLIDCSVKMADRTLCSIFVNPTQFNEKEDLKTYPRTLEEDLFNLLDTGADALFIPGVAEIYPDQEQIEVDFDFGGLANRMEGAHRPGHFEGVVQVVHRLLNIVEPDCIILGQKDYQQWAILRKLAEELHPEVEVMIGPTVREEDGLAMSSRNRRLSEEMRDRAPALYEALTSLKDQLGSTSTDRLVEEARKELQSRGLEPEYVELVDGYTLLPVRQASEHEVIVACAAAWAGDVRLIDNVICKGNPA